MSQLNRVAEVLSRNTTSRGITVSAVAKAARVPKNNVYKRISDLRREGVPIESYFQKVNGKRKVYYHLAV